MDGPPGSIFRSSRSRRQRRRDRGRHRGQRLAVTALEVTFVAIVIFMMLAIVDVVLV